MIIAKDEFFGENVNGIASEKGRIRVRCLQVLSESNVR